MIKIFFKTIFVIILASNVWGKVMSQNFDLSKNIAMDFRDVDVDSVLNFFGEASGLSIVKDPSLEGRVSITTFGHTSVDRALAILNSVLSVKGFTFVKTGEVLKVIPLKDVSRSDVDVRREEATSKQKVAGDTVVTQIISLQYAKAEEVVDTLKPLVGRFGSAIAYDRTNTMIVTDTAGNIARLIELIKNLDRQHTSYITRSYKIEFAEVEALQNLLRKILDQYKLDLGDISIHCDKRTRSLFVTTLPENFEKVEKLVKQLDRGVPQVLLNIEIVRVPSRAMDVDVRNHLFDAVLSNNASHVASEVDQIFDWKYGLDAKKETMFSWYGASFDKDKEDFIYTLQGLYGSGCFSIYSLPIVTMSEGQESHISIGRENCFYRLGPIDIDFKIVPYLTTKNTLTLKMFQAVRVRGGKENSGYANIALNDNQTVVLGGLQENVAIGNPYIKPAYRANNMYVNNEFLVFLTPHIVSDPITMRSKGFSTGKNSLLTSDGLNLEALFPGGFMEFEAPKVVKSSGDFEEVAKKGPLMFYEGDTIEGHANHLKNKYGHAKENEKVDHLSGLRDLVRDPSKNVQVTNAPFVDRHIKSSVDSFQKLVGPQVSTAQNVTEKEIAKSSLKSFKDTDFSSSSDKDKESYVLKETLFRRGIALYKAGNYKQAIREFAPIIAIDPQFKDVSDYMKNAQVAYKDGLKENLPVDPSQMLKKSGEQASSSNVEQEKPSWEDSFFDVQEQSHPDVFDKEDPFTSNLENLQEGSLGDASVKYMRGVDLYKSGRYEDAIREFSEILLMNPSYKDCQKYLALAQEGYSKAHTMSEELSGERRNVEKAYQEKSFQHLVNIPETMDQRKNNLSSPKKMEDFYKKDRFFEYEGDPKNIPSDRIEKAEVSRVSGEILEISPDHPLVVINLGSLQNLHKGMIFDVYRTNACIGKLRVAEVGENVSGAEILSIEESVSNGFVSGDKILQSSQDGV